MQNLKSLTFHENPAFLLALILTVFFLKGVFFVAILPIFQGPDEAIHYATIQHLAEPEEKNWDIYYQKREELVNDGGNTDTYNYSEEIMMTAKISKFDEINFHSNNTPLFLPGSDGILEQAIDRNSWKKYIDIFPPAIVGGSSLYYSSVSQVEKLFSSYDILIRFFSIRLFSVLLGVFVVLFAYLATVKIGMSKKHALVISTIIAFQPMFTQTAAIINYDIPLIFAFSLFTYVGVSLLKDGFQWKYMSLLFLGAIIGTSVKGPGMALLGLILPILAYLAYKKTNFGAKKFSIYLLAASIIVLAVFLAFGPKGVTGIFTTLPETSIFSSPIESLQKYSSATFERWNFFELTYWGSFGWLDARVSNNALAFIWLIEAISLIGMIFGLFFKKTQPSFLPEKKYVVFFIMMLLSLQILIRFYDWRVFHSSGSILIGTPGRYFLPNIISHFLVLFYGLGVLCTKRKYFDILLTFSLILMVGFFFYSLFDIVIPRYYL